MLNHDCAGDVYKRQGEELCEFLGVFRILLDHIPAARMLLAAAREEGSAIRDRIVELGMESKVDILNVLSLIHI